MNDRAAKRARTEDAASGPTPAIPSGEQELHAASGPTPAIPSGEQELQNPFDALPDELVQRIISLFEPTYVWEVLRLQQVDRRLRRLVRGVDWDELELRIELDGLEVDAFAPHMQKFKELIDRMTARVRGGDVRGARQLCIFIPSYGDEASFSMTPYVVPMLQITESVPALVAAVAVAPVPLEKIHFVGDFDLWPSVEEQLDAGLAPRSLGDFAAAVLVALSPAKALASFFTESDFASSVADACVDLPAGCLPAASTLHELIFCGREEDLDVAQAAAIVRAWPELRSVELRFDSAAALAELARLPSLEVVAPYVTESGARLDSALVALAGAPGAATRLRELWLRRSPTGFGSPVPGPEGVAAILSLRSLQRLSIAVDPSSAAQLGGLAALERLRELDIYLHLLDSEGSSAALLAAASAALAEKARSLGRLCLWVEAPDLLPESDPSPIPGGLVSLLRAARPALGEFRISNRPASPEFIRELALCGPKLSWVNLDCFLPGSATVRELVSFRELVALSEDRLPCFKMSFTVHGQGGPRLSRPTAVGILKSWLHGIPAIRVWD